MNSKTEGVHVRIGTGVPNEGPEHDYRVIVYMGLKSDDRLALFLRITVAQTIEWVRSNVDELVKVGLQKCYPSDAHRPVVALAIETV